MKGFIEKEAKIPYFIGWYFKHQKKKNTISLIPGIQFDDSGSASAFIQVITNNSSYYIKYPYYYFKIHPKKLCIKIGNNVFSRKGVRINIQCPELQLSGNIRYDEFLPIRYNIMGPLCLIPRLKCIHGIISMDHCLHGKLRLNGEDISFDNGHGYIETDSGSSFPNNYFWSQCNDFKERACSIVAAVADIDILCKSIRGCFALINYEGKEYRLATYLGAKVVVFRSNLICIRQGKYTLYINNQGNAPQHLKAPVNGRMTRTIKEYASGHGEYRFYKSGKKLFQLSSKHASYEYVRS